MTLKKNHFTLWLAFLFVTIVYSQNSLQGLITSKANNESLAFVNIYIPELEKGTTSDENGLYSLNGLPIGTYKVIFSYIGYETYSIQINVPYTDSLNVILNPSAIEMEEIIISTPFHKLQSENVMKVEHQKIDELKKRGAVNLANGISTIPGVESISTGLSIGKPVIRGLSSNRVLVYTQGVRLENQQFGDEHGLGISDSGIESVEVIKGPASLLYGSDALGGVLYLNPEKFANQNTQLADASIKYFTNTQGFSTNAGFRSSSELFKFSFRGSLAEHSDYKTPNYRVTNTRFREKDLKAGFGYQKSSFRTELRYNINASQLGIPEEINIQNTNTTPLSPFQNITNHIFSSKSSLFFENSRLDANFGFTYNDRKEFEEIEEEGEDDPISPALHMKLKSFNYDLKFNLPKLGKFETIVGIQGMFQSNLNYSEEILIPDANTNDLGLLATSHIHFEKLDIQLGARFDRRTIKVIDGIDRGFNSFNGALGARTNLDDNIITRLNLATGFRAPNLAELTSFGTHEGTNRFEIGNPDLTNEQNFQIDLSIEYKSEHLELYANAFYNKINDYIFLSPDGEFVDEDPVYVYLQENAELYGGEFGIHFHPHPFDWLHLESSFETVKGQRSNGFFLPLIPAQKLNNTIRFDLKEGWLEHGYGFIKVSSVFDQDNISSFETSTQGYNLLSAGIGGTIKLLKHQLEISISGTNLTNKNYINHLSRLKTDGISNMGRNLSFELTYKL